MAVTFNPSITNYKPSFAGKQKASTSSAHANLATAADTVSIAAKPVVKNTLGHRAKMFLAALPFGAAALLGASCQDPKPPIVVKPPVDDYLSVPSYKTIDNILDSLNVGEAKAGELRSEITLFHGWTNDYRILKFDYEHSNDDVCVIKETKVMPGAADSTYLEHNLVRKKTGLVDSLFALNYPLPNQRTYMGTSNSYHMASKDEGLIMSYMNQPSRQITNGGTQILNSKSLISVIEDDIRQIEILDVKYVTKSPKELKNAVKTALKDSVTVAQKAAKTIR